MSNRIKAGGLSNKKAESYYLNLSGSYQGKPWFTPLGCTKPWQPTINDVTKGPWSILPDYKLWNHSWWKLCSARSSSQLPEQENLHWDFWSIYQDENASWRDVAWRWRFRIRRQNRNHRPEVVFEEYNRDPNCAGKIRTKSAGSASSAVWPGMSIAREEHFRV